MNNISTRTADSSTDQRHHLSQRLTLGAVLLVAFGLRAWEIQVPSLSMDEWYEVHLAATDVDQILAAGDGFPPLYHLLLHAWLKIWGADSARWLSVCLGVGTVWVVERAGARIAGSRVGLAAAALSAILPIHVWFGQEARCYSLVLFLTAWALWGCVALVEQPTRCAFLGFLLAIVAGMYTHYFFAFVVLALGGWLLWNLGWRLGGSGWWWAAASLLLLIPLFFLLRADLRTQLNWAHKQHFDLAAWGYTYFTFFSGFTLGPSLDELHALPRRAAIREFLPWISALAGVLGGIVVTGVRVMMAEGALRAVLRSHRAGMLLAICGAGPFVVGASCQLLDVGYQVRYSLWASVPLTLCLGWIAVEAWRRPLGVTAVCGLVGWFGAAIVQRHTDVRYANPDVRAAALHVSYHDQDRRPVVVLSAYMVPVFQYYLRDENRRVVRLPNEFDPAQSLEAFQRVVRAGVPRGTECWLLLCRDYHDDPRGELAGWLRSQSVVLDQRNFAGATLFHLRFADVIH